MRTEPGHLAKLEDGKRLLRTIVVVLLFRVQGPGFRVQGSGFRVYGASALKFKINYFTEMCSGSEGGRI